MAQAAVIASHSEGSPNALLEAMSAGLPIVATRVGGIPEIAADGESALLVEAHNPEALAQAIRRLLQDAGAARLAGGMRTSGGHNLLAGKLSPSLGGHLPTCACPAGGGRAVLSAGSFSDRAALQ